jgi:hypothetical protein
MGSGSDKRGRRVAMHERCVNPHCPDKDRRRALGLCTRCHRMLLRLFEAGVVTPEQAVRDGLCLEPRKLGRARFPQLVPSPIESGPPVPVDSVPPTRMGKRRFPVLYHRQQDARRRVQHALGAHDTES